MLNLLNKLARNEEGGEVLEYALIAGLIIVGAIALIASSEESGPTPSKKTPTSAFHCLR